MMNFQKHLPTAPTKPTKGILSTGGGGSMNYLETLRKRQMGGNKKFQKPLPAAPTKPTKGGSGWTPPTTPPTPWTDEQWGSFCDLVGTLERHPQLWSGLRKYAQKTLHRDLYQALVREGYGTRKPVPVPDSPRGGRVRCRECLRHVCAESEDLI